MTLCEDAQSQLHGNVFIIHQMSPLSQLHQDPFQRQFSYRLSLAMPLRIPGIHICIPDNPLSQIAKAASMASFGPQRVKVKVHVGTFPQFHNLTLLPSHTCRTTFPSLISHRLFTPSKHSCLHRINNRVSIQSPVLWYHIIASH